MPWISATDCENSALASRNPTVSTPVRAIDVPTPTAGMTALAPTAAPPVVTAVRNRRSRMRMISSGVASGRRLRSPRMWASTIGRCTESTRSIVRCIVGLLFVRSAISLRAMPQPYPRRSLRAGD
jgi:hypothetical protein